MSCPSTSGLPVDRQRCSTLNSTQIWTRLWRSLLQSPHAPATRHSRSPKPWSLATSAPVSPGAVPCTCWSNLSSGRRYVPGSSLARRSARISVSVGYVYVYVFVTVFSIISMTSVQSINQTLDRFYIYIFLKVSTQRLQLLARVFRKSRWFNPILGTEWQRPKGKNAPGR